MKNRIFTRTIILVSLISFFNDISSEMLYPIMPVYLKSIGFSVVLIGILEGIAEAVAGFSKGYFGQLSDNKGKRLPFVQLGYALSAISKPMLAFLVNPVWIFIARTTDRLGKGVRTSARDAILSDESSKENKGKVFGFHRAFDTLGATVGPVLALLFLHHYPEQYKWLFIFAFIPGVVSVLISLLVKEKNKIVKNNSKTHFFSFISYWKKSDIRFKYLVIGLLAFAFFNSSDVFLLLMLKYNGLSDTQMLGMYIFYNTVYAIASLPVGYLGDKIGLFNLLIIGLLLFVAVYFSFGFNQSIIVFVLLFFVYGIYASATDGISKALITNIAKSEYTATALGFFNGFSSIATLLASSVGGLLFYINPKLMFFFSGTGVLIVIIYLLYIKSKKLL